MEDNRQSAVADGLETESTQTETAAPRNEAAEAGAELAQQNAELQDRLLRLQAEFDNFRKRTERERLDFAEYAGEQAVRALLPILDDFERALKAAASGAEGADFVRGIELIYNRFLDVLKKQGLEPISTEGAQFDPHLHQAIGRVESAEHEDNTIVQEFQRGYNFKGRLLRPSMVQVAVKS
jgi:molecular chaperone GrpE